MAETSEARDVRPDFYVAAIGRSGSTMMCNWLTHAPEQLVFNEPFFTRAENSRLLRIDLANFGMAASENEWRSRNESAEQRFARLMTPRLAGSRWAFKEVLSEEHYRALEQFGPRKVVIVVRDIVDVALSFFEKHRAQGNLERFSDEWVVGYCVDEAASILRFKQHLELGSVPHRIVRYEDFTRSTEMRKSLEDFVEWKGGGDIASNLNDFGRGFEIVRHGTSISGSLRERRHRVLGRKQFSLATDIGERCGQYQTLFGYDMD